MELLHERCAALDIGKKDLKAYVRTPSPNPQRTPVPRSAGGQFPQLTRDLRILARPARENAR